LIDDNIPMPEAIKENRDLGIMLYDIDYESDKQESLFFRAKMDEGIIIVPHKDSEEILR
jgi:CRISPR-associated protein Cas5d